MCLLTFFLLLVGLVTLAKKFEALFSIERETSLHWHTIAYTWFHHVIPSPDSFASKGNHVRALGPSIKNYAEEGLSYAISSATEEQKCFY